MASKIIKITATSNEIILPIDDVFVGKYIKITITDKVAPPRVPRPKIVKPKVDKTDEMFRNLKEDSFFIIDLSRKPDESVIDDVPAWSNLFKNPKPVIKDEKSKEDFSDKVTISKKIIIDKFDYEEESDSITDRDKELLNSFTFEEDITDVNTNIIEDEPNWNSNKPLDKDLDILGHSEKSE
ncbi:hypothetical protein [Flavobacterium capsici]|uniref:Uncharacterized protein n=1 Tax=Flavobacterium capsici TaxID=3075618 RepID=A0AA96F3B1_9FLAO|nr:MULTISPECIES: hypothetical protein [unclassified Flavobacterium]WNM17782.1 hypothetical protein RN608_07120 [Flavobacterium sp. PMR2A8]WNM21835.1 hypothetical protein RN605_00420 [Flavobacterium sp. PMTSA4]